MVTAEVLLHTDIADVHHSDGQWYEMNDTAVRRIKPNDISGKANEALRGQAYMLWYVRDGSGAIRYKAKVRAPPPARGPSSSQVRIARLLPDPERLEKDMRDLYTKATILVDPQSETARIDEQLCPERAPYRVLLRLERLSEEATRKGPGSSTDTTSGTYVAQSSEIVPARSGWCTSGRQPQGQLPPGILQTKTS